MIRRLGRPSPSLIVGTVALVATLGGVAVAGIGVIPSASSPATINACVKKKGGQLRVVKKAGKCRRGERAVALQGAGGVRELVGPEGKQGEAGPQGLQGVQGPPGPSTGPAGGDLTGSYPNPSIAFNAVGPSEIENINRIVHLPLLSFINSTDMTVLDTVPSDGTSPDLTRPGNHIEIEWDDNATGAADSDFILTNFAVPDDYASGGHYLVTAAKDADTGVEERFTCNVVLNRFVGGGQDSGNFSISDLVTGRSNYFLVPSVTYAPGDSVAVSCRADDGSGGTTANDVVWLEQIRFRYIASQ